MLAGGGGAGADSGICVLQLLFADDPAPQPSGKFPVWGGGGVDTAELLVLLLAVVALEGGGGGSGPATAIAGGGGDARTHKPRGGGGNSSGRLEGDGVGGGWFQGGDCGAASAAGL